MPQHDSIVYTFTIERQASHFFEVVLHNYLTGPGKDAGVERAFLDGSAIVVEFDSSKREALLAVLDFLANHNGGVRDEGMGGVAVPVEERPFPPRGPRVLLGHALLSAG